MNNKYIKTIIITVGLITLSGCGKTSNLPVGNNSFGSGILSEGGFDAITVDTSFISGDFSVSDSYVYSDGYEYILSVYDYRTSSTGDYFLKFDKSGNTIVSGSIDKPVFVEDDSVVVSNEFKNSINLSSSDYSDISVDYSGFSFDQNGGFSSFCEVDFYVYSELLGNYYSDQSNYYITWNADGKCVSVEATEEYPVYSSPEYIDYFIGADGNKYRLTDSGISLLDADGKYAGKYFDFLNSDIFSFGFDTVNIFDSESFSAVYRDEYFRNVICCFVKKSSTVAAKPIVLACSDLDNDLKRDIYSFNSENNGYKITVYDYSDLAENADPVEGWFLLKEAVAGGYRPDILLNNSGYDYEFIQKMGKDGVFCDLNGILNGDEDLASVNFTEKAHSLYYSGNHIYAIVPSFEYHTIVGSAKDFSADINWGYDGFLSYASPIVSDSALFDCDTKEKFLKRFLSYSGYDFVDFDKKQSSFESDTFVKYLEFMNMLSTDIVEASERQYSDGIGKFYLSDITCTNLGDMNMYSTLFSCGEYKDLGFPGEKSGSGMINASCSFMILSERAYTNECWGFIKRYLTMDYQNSMLNEIPVTVTGFIEWKNNLIPYSLGNFIPTYYDNGDEKTVEMLTDDGAKTIIDSFNACDRVAFSDYKIESIVMDYATQYFEGEITAQEAAASIDREVENYLAS